MNKPIPKYKQRINLQKRLREAKTTEEKIAIRRQLHLLDNSSQTLNDCGIYSYYSDAITNMGKNGTYIIKCTKL